MVSCGVYREAQAAKGDGPNVKVARKNGKTLKKEFHNRKHFSLPFLYKHCAQTSSLPKEDYFFCWREFFVLSQNSYIILPEQSTRPCTWRIFFVSLTIDYNGLGNTSKLYENTADWSMMSCESLEIVHAMRKWTFVAPVSTDSSKGLILIGIWVIFCNVF